MLATAVDAPFDSPDYSFEVKWDGLRCLCAVSGGSVRLFSRNRRDITRSFPELNELHRAVAVYDGLFDGELCVFRDALPNFHAVQRRNLLGTDRAIMRAAVEEPALYIIFDVLRRDNEDTMPLPWLERRRRLEDMWRGADGAILSDPVRERGVALFNLSTEQGLEGVVAKRHDGPYIPGRRTRHWLKVRHVRELDCVIGGYVPRGSHHNDLASLALGLFESDPERHLEDRRLHSDDRRSYVNEPRRLEGPHRSNVQEKRLQERTPDLSAQDERRREDTDRRHEDADRLVYVGNVGTGFSARTRRELLELLTSLRIDRPPFDVNHSSPPPPAMIPVAPRLVCRVAYSEFTPAGHLRHPTFRGLRDDQLPTDCTMPPERS